MDYSAIAPGNMLPPEELMAGQPGLHQDALLSGHAGLVPAPPDGMADAYKDDMYAHDEFVEVKNLMVDGGDRFGVSATVADGQTELLWMGNLGGHVTSYYGLDMQKYTSFQVHATNEIRQLLTIEKQVFSLTRDSLHCHSKFGIPQFKHMSESMQDMQCMLQTGPSNILMGGHQTIVVEYDVEAMCEIRQVEVEEPGCAIFRGANGFICSGDTSGKVTLRDPKSLHKEHVLQAHSGTLSDFDVHGNQLVTCGFSNRMGNLAVDRLLMLYDLRMMRATTPMQVHLDPLFLRFVPTYTNRICVVSQTGNFQILEQGAMSPSSMIMYQVQTEGAAVTCFDMSSSCQALAFGDGGGFLHLFATGEHPVYNVYSTETEFASVEHLEHSININDEMTPLSIIPMQYPTTGRLLSEWPDELCSFAYRKPLRIDPEILRNMQICQQVGYAPNPGSKRRNQVQYKLPSTGRRKERKSSVPESPGARTEDPFTVIPKKYLKVEIKYSKLGVEDFDFRHYNKTNFAGLETHIPNAYCNAMLQILYFIEPLRCILLGHLCEKEFCLSCELGFLFHMLDSMKGRNCQASNFLRAFRTIPEASALGLVLSDTEEFTGKANLPRLIQNWNRFILQQIHSELVEAAKLAAITGSPDPPNIYDSLILKKQIEQDSSKVEGASSTDAGLAETSQTLEKPEEPSAADEGTEASAKDKPADDDTDEPIKYERDVPNSIIKKLFGSSVENHFKCKCGENQSRTMTSCIVDLSYPDINDASKFPRRQHYTFSEILQRSMCQEQTTQAWCRKCEKYQPHVQSKQVKSIPDILALNCHLENSRDADFWQLQEQFMREKKIEPTNAALNPRSNVRPCRYGTACTRKDCKFRHENDAERSVELDPLAELNKLLDEGNTANAWIPMGLKLKLLPDGRVEVDNVEESEIPDKWEDESIIYYDLLATVAHIKDPKSSGNLVSHVKVGETYHQRKERVTCTQWYLLNDFSITPIEPYEAVYYNLDWKFPCVVYFARRLLNKKHPVEVINPIKSNVLFMNASLVTPRRKHITFLPLDDEELPKSGDIVGLDAEFVTLNQEEAELRSDGTRSTIKPSQMAVARTTCIRGHGPLFGEPFIDDYISTQEQVVDYVTQFSGIKPGDLDASISSKHLTTLKSTYLKMRYLVDVGAIFVGHGLKKDFRVINLVVPKDQILDTAELFQLPRQRIMSLKFLAWYFLGINIQSLTHDSIEDARTAVKLYLKYQEMSQTGMDNVRAALKDMYEKGRKLQWKIAEGFVKGEDLALDDIPALPPQQA